MINPNHGLRLARQAELLELSRASLYYEPVGTSDADLRLMRRRDELHLRWPFVGSRMLRDELRLEGNVFVERLWRSVKYEGVYLHADDSVAAAKASIGRYLSRPRNLSKSVGPPLSPGLVFHSGDYH